MTIKCDMCRISDDVILGNNVKLHAFINLYGCKIGDDSLIGTFVEIQKNSIVGSRVKISSHSFVCEGVHIEDNVFIGHGVMFTNVSYPRSTTNIGLLQRDGDWEVEKTIIKKGSSIGSGSVILCGNIVGENAIVGAGSIVTKNIPDNEVWAGNPAKFLRKLNE